MSASVAAWFVRRHSEPGTEPDDVISAGVETAAATTTDSQALLLGRRDELAAKQDEIRAILIELQQRRSAADDQTLPLALGSMERCLATDCAITRRG